MVSLYAGLRASGKGSAWTIVPVLTSSAANACKKKPPEFVFRRLKFAETVSRTPDPSLFRRMLYQLSYLGSGDRPRFNACASLPVSQNDQTTMYYDGDDEPAAA